MNEKDGELIKSETDGAGIPKPEVSAESSFVSKPATSNSSTSLTNEQQVDSDRARQEEEWRSELFRLENEMATLRTVLIAKTKEAEDLKKRLGITPLVEFREDLRLGFQTIKESDPIQKTSSAFKDFGEYASKKLDNLRNTSAFKSVEEKVGGAYSNVKKRMTSKSEEGENQEAESAGNEGGTSPTDKVQGDYLPLQP